jgi:hypothetical protein
MAVAGTSGTLEQACANWREGYRLRRYLQHADHDELTRRLDDIFVNVIRFTDSGVAVVPAPLELNPYSEMLVHVIEELRLRGWPDEGFAVKHLHFDNAKYPSVTAASTLWNKRALPSSAYLLKYGSVRHLRALLTVGALRVAPASYYRDPSLNHAVRDSELEFRYESCSAKVRRPPNNDRTIPSSQWVEMPVIGNVRFTESLEHDYYMSCFSSRYENRLFDDFEANACLVIKDIRRFGESLRARMQEVLPSWTFMCRSVEYRDSYRMGTRGVNIVFTKHFRYAYQAEFRFAWVPPGKTENLKPIHLELGPLRDYCELFEL